MVNNKNIISAGIVGTGFGSRVILPCLSAVEGIKVVALVTRNTEKVQNIVREYDVPHVFDSLEKLLELKDLDLVCVATPPFLHCSMAEQILKAGKHLLCEKPLALNTSEARQMCEQAQKSGRLHMVDHQMRFQPNIREIKSLLQNDALGEIYHVELSYLTATRVDTNIPWDWWSDEQLGGGQLNALGSHCIDILQWWFDDVKTAHGCLKTITRERNINGISGARPVTSDEYALFHLQLENGVNASVAVSSVAKDDSGIRVRIVGRHGTVLLDGFDRLLFIGKKDSIKDVSAPDPLISRPVIGINPWRTSLVRMAEHFVTCIREDRSVRGATFYDGFKTQKVLDAVRLSWKENRQINIADMQ